MGTERRRSGAHRTDRHLHSHSHTRPIKLAHEKKKKKERKRKLYADERRQGVPTLLLSALIDTHYRLLSSLLITPLTEDGKSLAAPPEKQSARGKKIQKSRRG